MASGKVKFCMVRSEPDVAFWYQLASRKLDEWKLSEEPQQLTASVLLAPIGFGQPEAAFSLDYSAFSANQTSSPSSLTLRVGGKLTVYNTVEALQNVDKQQILRNSASELQQLIASDELLDHPEKLVNFILLCFADLKKYDVLYWFAFPALHFTDIELLAEPVELVKAIGTDALHVFNDKFNAHLATQSAAAAFCVVLVTCKDGHTQIYTLRQFYDLPDRDQLLQQVENTVYFGLLDGCTLPRHPGWLVRNFLVAIAQRFPVARSRCNVLCLRPKFAPSSTSNVTEHRVQYDLADSLLLTMRLCKADELPNLLDCVGWERNTNSQLAPRRVKLAEAMQPERLAQNAVDLNVSLMKWRVAPNLNLDAIRNKRCVLFGCGTLGCNVARLLLAWGVRHLVLIDHGDVSYSNPVRQSLFEFSDAMDLSQRHDKADSEHLTRNKAHVAARMLRRVHPAVNVVPHAISVPMPGHSVGESETARQAARQAVLQVEQLVQEADVVFLLLDSREARWLPTVVAQSKHKLVVNAALGFDSFLVVRHGVQSTQSDACAHKIAKLGCYFCTDVVAPTNSTRNRTLDQQCTVTRPGLSYIASAFAVELFSAICQHPDGASADAENAWKSNSNENALGAVPHQIRGFLSSYQFLTPSACAFDRCTGCSRSVIEAYERDGFDFLLRVFNDSDYLEELTGLREMKLAAERQLDEDMITVLGDDEDF